MKRTHMGALSTSRLAVDGNFLPLRREDCLRHPSARGKPPLKFPTESRRDLTLLHPPRPPGFRLLVSRVGKSDRKQQESRAFEALRSPGLQWHSLSLTVQSWGVSSSFQSSDPFSIPDSIRTWRKDDQ